MCAYLPKREGFRPFAGRQVQEHWHHFVNVEEIAVNIGFWNGKMAATVFISVDESRKSCDRPGVRLLT
jgi:hypothetical protein